MLKIGTATSLLATWSRACARAALPTFARPVCRVHRLDEPPWCFVPPWRTGEPGRPAFLERRSCCRSSSRRGRLPLGSPAATALSSMFSTRHHLGVSRCHQECARDGSACGLRLRFRNVEPGVGRNVCVLAGQNHADANLAVGRLSGGACVLPLDAGGSACPAWESQCRRRTKFGSGPAPTSLQRYCAG